MTVVEGLLDGQFTLGIEEEFQKPGEAAIGGQVEGGGSGGRGEARIGAAFEQQR